MSEARFAYATALAPLLTASCVTRAPAPTQHIPDTAQPTVLAAPTVVPPSAQPPRPEPSPSPEVTPAESDLDGLTLLKHPLGPCVVPPVRGWAVEVDSEGEGSDGEWIQHRTRSQITNTLAPDLDGDDAPEVLVPLPSDEVLCPWEVAYGLYIMRGDCGHLVGTVVGPFSSDTPFTELDGHAVRFKTEAQWVERSNDGPATGGPPPQRMTLTREYSFDGAALVNRGIYHTDGDCHHCMASRCSAP